MKAGVKLYAGVFIPKPIQILFDLGRVAVAVTITEFLFRIVFAPGRVTFSVAIAAAACFSGTAISIAGVIALTGSKSIRQIWQKY
jgi:hypothetical protein